MRTNVFLASSIVMASLLLDGEQNDYSVPDSIMQNLLLQQPGQKEEIKETDTKPLYQFVIPEAGFCMKTKCDKNEKVFINICKSEQVPSPKEITDEQLQSILQSGDPTQFRVPLSLGEPHIEKDNSGKDCQTYDVIINSKFFYTIQKRPNLKDFLLTIVIEGLEEKYNTLLSRDCRVLKNRRFVGNLPEQTVRQKLKPFIIEMDSNSDRKTPSRQKAPAKNLTMERATLEPQYTLLREPVSGEIPEFLVLEVKLPGISSSKHISLEVGEDQLCIFTRPSLYQLHLDLPYLLNCEDTAAQFNKHTSTLTVTLTVTGHAPT